MAMLAIKWHATRGKEVIEILEMLGGKIRHDRLAGNKVFCWYYIDKNGYIDYMNYSILYDATVFTLEQFLEKFPYKVGDKVYYDNKVCDVIEMLWNSNLNTISYGVYDGKIKSLAIAEELKSYKEETMEEIKIDIPNGYEFFGIDDDNKIVLTKQQPQYPKTYEGCCKITRSDPAFYIDTDLYSDKLAALYKLLICRDAYWKIAGEQLGLGKPWEPDWHDDEWLDMYYISWDGKHLEKENGYPCCNIILIFPSAEMRDSFYDNFKELIEECKELL